MRDRIITAIALAAGLLVAIFLVPPAATALAFALIVLGGAWEWAGFVDAPRSTRARLTYVLLVAVALALAWWGLGQGAEVQVLLWIAMLWWLAAFIWILRFPTSIPRSVTLICGLLALVPAWVALARLQFDHGPAWLLFVIVLTVSADIGAFIVGRLVGRVRLAPRVSPGKTWEGLVGGVVAAAAVATAGAWWFALPASRFVPMCVVVALVSVVGDLTVSMFKRHAGLKDSSDLLPGHGGILDRIDSLASAVPAFVLGLGWLLDTL